MKNQNTSAEVAAIILLQADCLPSACVGEAARNFYYSCVWCFRSRKLLAQEKWIRLYKQHHSWHVNGSDYCPLLNACETTPEDCAQFWAPQHEASMDTQNQVHLPRWLGGWNRRKASEWEEEAQKKTWLLSAAA